MDVSKALLGILSLNSLVSSSTAVMKRKVAEETGGRRGVKLTFD